MTGLIRIPFAIVLGSLLLSGCFKEDEKIVPHPRGDVKIDTVAMTPTYKYQVYFDLDSVGIIRSNDKSGSDLAFECAPGGWHILLNTAGFMYAADLGSVPFALPQDTAGAKWWFDRSDGDPDSTAIGLWFSVTETGDTVSNGHVYAVNRGIDDMGNPLGYVQVIFDSLSGGTYYFRYAPLSGGQAVPASVRKDPAVNYLYFTFGGVGEIRPLEPPKDTWDLLFTQYTTLLFTDLGEPYPYIVTGVLINRNGNEVAVDTLNRFPEITYDIAGEMHFSSDLDAIGYEWKYYDFDAGSYSVTPGLTYVILNHSGYYYKLRFIGFYNEAGQKGYPSFEYQRL